MKPQTNEMSFEWIQLGIQQKKINNWYDGDNDVDVMTKCCVAGWLVWKCPWWPLIWGMLVTFRRIWPLWTIITHKKKCLPYPQYNCWLFSLGNHHSAALITSTFALPTPMTITFFILHPWRPILQTLCIIYFFVREFLCHQLYPMPLQIVPSSIEPS